MSIAFDGISLGSSCHPDGPEIGRNDDEHQYNLYAYYTIYSSFVTIAQFEKIYFSTDSVEHLNYSSQ